MLKEMKRTSVKRIWVRQGLKHKNHDLFVKILKGGRTGMQNRENPGTLNQNRQSGTMDLGSNGYRCARVPWTVPCARCTGPRWSAPLNTKGYAI
jgi:hypothetical protein